jgi:hypothetical protein
MRRRLSFIAALAGLVLLAAACGGGDDGPGNPQTPESGSGSDTVGSSFHPVAGNFEPDDTELGSCGGDFRCLEQAFGNIVHEDGPKRAFEVLAESLRSVPGVEANCHRIVHTMGSAGLARYDGDVARTFSEGDSTCNSGYYHGILERSFAGAKSELELQTRANEVCRSEEIRLTQWLNFNCLHGLGHGLMIQTGYNLPTSLEICTGLDSRWNRDVCAGGAFMENFFTSYNVKSRFVRDDNLTYPCDAELISDDYRTACYLIVAARLLEKTSFDWARTAAICDEVQTRYRPVCFESYGRDASGHSAHKPAEIAAKCRLPRVDQRACFFGASRELTSHYAEPRRATELCRMSRGDTRSWCFHGIGTIVASIHSDDAAARRRACGSVGGADVASCMEGVAGTLPTATAAEG